MAHGEEEVRAFIRRCTYVFIGLMFLTIVTVAVSYLELDKPVAIAVGLAIALFKGSLVALFFMHLIDERKVVYAVMAMTLSFFALLMYLPSGWDHDLVQTDEVWTVLPHEGAVDAHGEAGDHGDAGDHGHDHGHDHGEGGH